MKEYYASILPEEFLMEKAKTDKRIGCALENLSLLNDDEYDSLYAFFMHEGCASNFVWRYTGSCYLMLLRERDPVRFRNNFSSAFFKTYGSCDNPVFLEDYIDLQGLLRASELVLTDSGGLQKEAYFHGKPCITLREETEWTELVALGFNTLVGADPERIARTINEPAPRAGMEGMYGDGRAAHLIARILAEG